jgi:uncharacterized membrane protein
VKKYVAPLGLALLAAAVRLPTISLQSLWLDEAYTVRLVKMSLGGMLKAIPRTESTPPVYYVLEWIWTRIFGYGELALRTTSALAGIATVLVVYAIGKKLKGESAAIIAGALAALSPIMIWYSQEARAYALAALLSSATILAVLGYAQTKSTRWLYAWALTAALGMATHYFVAFIVAPEAAWLVRRTRKPALIAAVAPLITALALLPLALAQHGTGHADYISQGSLITRVLQIPKELLVGLASPGQLFTGIAAALLAIVAIASAIFPARAALPGARGLTGLSLAAIAMPIALAVIGIDFVNSRNVIVALAPALVVIAIGFDSLSRPYPVAAVMCALFAMIVIEVDAHPIYQRDDWRGVSRFLGAATVARAIVVQPGSAPIALAPYMPRLSVLPPAPTNVEELDLVALGAHATGHGIQPPPRSHLPAVLAPGFVLSASTHTSTYTVLRYRDPRPATVAGNGFAGLAGYRLGPGPVAVLLQTPR